MKTKEIIIETLKEFEQIDYKKGGVSIAPEMYNAIADKICSRLSEKKYLFSINRDKKPNLFKIVANIPYFIITFDSDNHSLGKVYYDNTRVL